MRQLFSQIEIFDRFHNFIAIEPIFKNDNVFMDSAWLESYLGLCENQTLLQHTNVFEELFQLSGLLVDHFGGLIIRFQQVANIEWSGIHA